MRSLVYLVCGSILGIGVVVSCSDDSPEDADAAACDCPASEAPLVGRFVRVSSGPLNVAPNSENVTSAFCPDGATLMSGGCYVDDDQTGRQLALKVAGPDNPNQQTLRSWGCQYTNTSSVGAAVIHAEAVCLTPAP